MIREWKAIWLSITLNVFVVCTLFVHLIFHTLNIYISLTNKQTRRKHDFFTNKQKNFHSLNNNTMHAFVFAYLVCVCACVACMYVCFYICICVWKYIEGRYVAVVVVALRLAVGHIDGEGEGGRSCEATAGRNVFISQAIRRGMLTIVFHYIFFFKSFFLESFVALHGILFWRNCTQYERFCCHF